MFLLPSGDAAYLASREDLPGALVTVSGVSIKLRQVSRLELDLIPLSWPLLPGIQIQRGSVGISSVSSRRV